LYKILIAFIIISGCLGSNYPSENGTEIEAPQESSQEFTIEVIGEEKIGDFGKIKDIVLVTKEIHAHGDEYSILQAKYEWKSEMYMTGAIRRMYPSDKSIIPLAPPNNYYTEAFEWIKENTPEDAIFISWWDYGDLIRIFSQREVLISDPCDSLRCMETVNDDQKDVFRYEDNKKFEDIQNFFTSNESEAYKISKTYEASYIFITYEDFAKSWAINHIKGTNNPLQSFEIELTGDKKTDSKNISNELSKFGGSAYFIRAYQENAIVWFLYPEDVRNIKQNILLNLLPLKILPDNLDSRVFLDRFELVYTDQDDYICIFKVN
jgi:hydroxylamine oxidation protein HaoB